MSTQTSEQKKIDRRRPAAMKKDKVPAAAHPPSATAAFANAGKRRQDSGLARRFGIDETNLSWRREFIRLREDDREVLLKLVDWAASHAPEIAREFYDWQFSFPPTLAFFENFAKGRKISLSTLRQILESSQADYIVGAFAGAQ